MYTQAGKTRMLLRLRVVDAASAGVGQLLKLHEGKAAAEGSATARLAALAAEAEQEVADADAGTPPSHHSGGGSHGQLSDGGSDGGGRGGGHRAPAARQRDRDDRDGEPPT